MQTPDKPSPRVDGFRYDDGSVRASGAFCENPRSLVRATSWVSDSMSPLHSARYRSTKRRPSTWVPAMGFRVVGIWSCGVSGVGLCMAVSSLRKFGDGNGEPPALGATSARRK